MTNLDDPKVGVIDHQTLLNQFNALNARREQISREAHVLLQKSQNKKVFKSAKQESALQKGKHETEILKVMQNNRNRKFFGVSVERSQEMQKKFVQNDEMMRYLQAMMQKRKQVSSELARKQATRDAVTNFNGREQINIMVNSHFNKRKVYQKKDDLTSASVHYQTNQTANDSLAFSQCNNTLQFDGAGPRDSFTGSQEQ